MYPNATLSMNKFVMRVTSNFTGNGTIMKYECSLDSNIVIDNCICPVNVNLI